MSVVEKSILFFSKFYKLNGILEKKLTVLQEFFLLNKRPMGHIIHLRNISKQSASLIKAIIKQADCVNVEIILSKFAKAEKKLSEKAGKALFAL